MRGGRPLAHLALRRAGVLIAAAPAARALRAAPRRDAHALRDGVRRGPARLDVPPRPARRPAPGAGRVGRVDEAPPRRRNRSPRAPLPDRRRGPDPGDLQPRPVRRAPGAPRHSRAARAPRSLTLAEDRPLSDRTILLDCVSEAR